MVVVTVLILFSLLLYLIGETEVVIVLTQSLADVSVAQFFCVTEILCE